ncbi:hypothetical protein HHI36_001102, partial [Cryptolaemus montrouzieri]
RANTDFHISSRTLRRVLASGARKRPLGRAPDLGFEHDERRVRHIKALEKMGFSSDSGDVTSMAYSFAEKLDIKHRFSKEQRSAGNDRLNALIGRNKQLALRKS